jgi:putative pyruvate formate lyase activating enzyme
MNQGHNVTDEELASTMLDLQNRGALNINLVSPTHMILPVLRALKIAYSRGLRLPIVYNSNGYEKEDILNKLEGIIDIYLPDIKYFSREVADKFSGAPEYFSYAGAAIREMYCQQPGLNLADNHIALEGMIIRHLILPGYTDDSLAILEWIAANLSRSVCLSIMSQYHPCFRAPLEIQRALTPHEYRAVVARAECMGFENLFIQPEIFPPDKHLIPDFFLPEPFTWRKI